MPKNFLTKVSCRDQGVLSCYTAGLISGYTAARVGSILNNFGFFT
jgi:hypothetical protein